MAGEKGRPTKHSQALAKKICDLLATGLTLREVCRMDDMPPESTVRQWALDNQGGFSAQYARAREIGYHSMADELMEISDDGQHDWMERNAEENEGWAANGEHMQRSRLRVDTRKWMLSKALPKIYGEKVDVKHDVSDDLAELLSTVSGTSKRIGT